ncbi:MAG TPA: c-type cytochrome [Vicinamibacterales bacterium]|nr:c-type cytochrome [Vicinamibacterales bacterium]
MEVPFPMTRVFVFVALVAAWTASATAQIPTRFTNLTVLPKDITQQQLVGLMRGFALNLGVRCEHCHVGEGNDLSRFDFASDARPAKATARQMLGLVSAINGSLAQSLGPSSDGARVTCFTCHRGARMPLRTAPGGSDLPGPVAAH